MIWLILNPIARGLAKLAALVLAVVTFGAWSRFKGAAAERDRQAEERAKADQHAHERMNHADLGLDASDDDRRQRLRDFAAKHGTGQDKGTGSGLRR